MARISRRHKIVRILFVIAAAVAWMGPPRPPAPPGCRGPRPPMPYHAVHDTGSPAAHRAAGAGVPAETR